MKLQNRGSGLGPSRSEQRRFGLFSRARSRRARGKCRCSFVSRCPRSLPPALLSPPRPSVRPSVGHSEALAKDAKKPTGIRRKRDGQQTDREREGEGERRTYLPAKVEGRKKRGKCCDNGKGEERRKTEDFSFLSLSSSNCWAAASGRRIPGRPTDRLKVRKDSRRVIPIPRYS